MNFKEVITYTNGIESRTQFVTRADWASFMWEQFKKPGEYNLTGTEQWIQPRIEFQRKGYYIDAYEGSRDFVDYWTLQREIILEGIIYDGVYVPGAYYFFLNFLPIIDKVKGTTDFGDVWDSHLYTFHYWELCICTGKDSCIVKKRQWGNSYIHGAYIMRNLWFRKSTVNKILAYDESYIDSQGSWRIIEEFRGFLNEHTGWYRNFSPDSPQQLMMQQRLQIDEGGKKKFVGNQSILKGITVKQSPSKGVGGVNHIVWAEEAGIFPTLDKVKKYVDSATKMGGVKTGIFMAAGSVGELREAEPLMKFSFDPNSGGFLGVDDINYELSEETCLFIPEWCNYISQEKDDRGNITEVIRCYDKDGNTNKELALEYINKARAIELALSPLNYNLHCSQHPLTLKEAFQERDDNPFPTHLINKRFLNLISLKPIVVTLHYADNNTVYHTLGAKHPALTYYPLRKDDDKCGAVVISEFPVQNAPTGLYYAAVDPVRNQKSDRSKSLFSIYVYKAENRVAGEYSNAKIVAWYTGRYDNAEESYEIARKLIKYYNAQTGVEYDIRDFIEFMIRKKDQRYLLYESQIMSKNSNITMRPGVKEPYGWRTGDGGKSQFGSTMKDELFNTLIQYCEEEISATYDMETGESTPVYGVDRFDDPALLQEMLSYSKRGNFDRIIAAAAVIMIANNRTTRGIVTVKEEPIKHVPNEGFSQFMNKYKLPNKSIGTFRTRYKLTNG